MIVPWNLQDVAKAFGCELEEWLRMKGSSLSQWSEVTVKNQLNGEMPEGQLEYDVVATSDHWASHVEVRNSFKNADFSPSTSTGKGRSFDPVLFEKKLRETDSYVVFDLNPIRDGFSSPRQYEIPSGLVADLYESGALGKVARIGFPERQNYTKSHGKEWYERPLRFKELFPYEQFAFEPNSAKKNYPTAGELVESAIKRIEQKLENKRGK